MNMFPLLIMEALISLSKLGGVMHDTCNCANAIARRVRVLRDESGKDLYGEEKWKRLSKEEHVWCDYFCGNHSRNVQFDAFSRLYESYIKRKLGAGLEAARLKSGGRVRVEPSQWRSFASNDLQAYKH